MCIQIKTGLKMDYELLYSILPKQPIRWTTNDVVTWLRFINLDGLCVAFADHHIDGSCLKDLSVEDLEGELLVRSVITKKKILKWIQEGFDSFDKFVENKKKNEFLIKTSEDMLIPRLHTSMMRDRINPVNQQPVSAFEPMHKLPELLITPYEGQNASFFTIDSKGAMIGKQSNHVMPVFEQSVDRDHAIITFKNNNFYLEDLGSKCGTYLRIRDKEVLQFNMIIEMGSYLFLVVRVTSEELVMLYCMTDAADAKEIVISSKLNKGFSIGRKNVADLFLDDQHMSGFHAKISFLGERFIIEDMSSTNGTWIRFSKPGEKSKPFPLEDKAVFKIGSTSTYSCRLKQPMQTQVLEKTKRCSCVVCGRPEKDGLLHPCKHNVSCYECSQLLRQCPVCQITVTSTIKIFI